MSLSTNKIILANATTNTAGAFFQTVTVNAVSTGNGTVVPAGVYIMFPSTDVTVLANNGSGNAVVVAANTGGVIMSDGVNVFVKNASGNATVTLLATNGGLSVSGTYNS